MTSSNVCFCNIIHEHKVKKQYGSHNFNLIDSNVHIIYKYPNFNPTRGYGYYLDILFFRFIRNIKQKFCLKIERRKRRKIEQNMLVIVLKYKTNYDDIFIKYITNYL